MRVVVFDLDDTLCKEIEFLKSAYMEIADYAAQMCTSSRVPMNELVGKTYKAMMNAYHSGRNAFETLNAFLGLNLHISDLLQMYREHAPHILLEDDVRYTLDSLKAEGVLMCIISDGRELTQWNKVRALELTEWMDESCIIINSSQECFKPNPYGYERLIESVRALAPEEELTFTYVGDNLNKDFIYPNLHGWQTVCLKDDGRNIHPQDFHAVPAEALPGKVIKSLREILDLTFSNVNTMRFSC